MNKQIVDVSEDLTRWDGEGGETTSAVIEVHQLA